MHLLRGAVRTYAWGSRTAIAEFTGRPSPTAHPEAELWFGAHPGDPAWLETDDGERSLLDAAAIAIPKASSAPRCAAASATRCRSWSRCSPPTNRCRCRRIRAPSRPSRVSRARSGSASRSSSPTRNYRDRSHKPELLVALEQFEALAGFRPAASTVELMRALAVSRPRPVRRPADRPVRRRRPAGAVHHVDHRAAARPRRAGARRDRRRHQLCPFGRNGIRGRGQDRARARRALSRRRRCAGRAAAEPDHPASPARPSICPPGNLHTYLHGVGVEVMANSDNVLRGGLTPKHVDVPELLRVLDFTPATEDVAASRDHQGRNRTGLRARRRRSSRCRCSCIDGEHLGHEVDAPSRHDGPQILLCTEGSSGGARQIQLR